MNISIEIGPSSSAGTRKASTVKRSTRRLSLPDYSSLIIPMKQTRQEPLKKKVESPSKKHPYEFEKARRPHQDTAEDMAIVETFKPKREYLPSQRRASMPMTKVEKFRFGGSARLKIARRSLHMHVTPVRRMEDSALTAFERQRQKHQMEEGALYAATRATEKAARSWKRKTIVLGPLGMVEEEETKVDKKQQRRESLIALLEKDTNKLNSSLTSLSSDDLSTSTPPVEKVKTEKGASGEAGYKLPFQISPTAVKEQKLRDVFKKQNAAAKRKSQAEKKERNIEAAIATKSLNKEDIKKPIDGKESQPKETSPKESFHQEHLRVLKVALKEAEASKEPALMSLVTFENTKQKSRRQSMPNISDLTKLQLEPNKASPPEMEKKETTKESPKKDRRSHMSRRSSAPDITSTAEVSRIAPGINPEETLKEMPKHILADIGTAPQREAAAGDEEDSVNAKKKTSKKKKGNRRSSMPDVNKDADSPASSSSSSKNGKSSKKKKGRRASMPDLSGVEKGDIYDWALAAKKQKENANNGGGEWKHIKSNANAVRRSPEEKILPLEPSKQMSNTSCLPKLEALLPLVQSQLREESVV